LGGKLCLRIVLKVRLIVLYQKRDESGRIDDCSCSYVLELIGKTNNKPTHFIFPFDHGGPLYRPNEKRNFSVEQE
jgi:hypothetical protein